MSTLTGFLTVAGGVLAGVGALTGKKDLVKLGSLMSLGGSIGNAFSDAATEAAAGAAEGAAEGAISEAAGDAAGEFAGAAGDAAAGAATSVPLTPGVLSTEAGAGAADQFAQQAVTAMPGAQSGAQAGAGAGAGAAPDVTPGSMIERASQSVPTTPGTLAKQFATTAPDALAQAGQELSSTDITSWLNRAKKAAGGVSNFMKSNPELVKVGGDMLVGMYGPEAEQADLLRKQQEEQMAWANRARANLNSPIMLKYRTGGT